MTLTGTQSADEREVMARRALTLALRTATALLGSGDAARDVAQDVAVIAVIRRGQLRDPQLFDQWVHRIAVRECSRAMRSSARRRANEQPLEERLFEGGTTIDRDDALTARQALADLPDRERIALTLRYVHDLSDKQIASAMKCRPGTVASLLSRGRRRLRSAPEMQTLLTSSGGRS